MELRSQSKHRDNEEYKELKITLRGLGFLDDEMELKEMQNIMQALQMSETSVMEQCNNAKPLFNSTMIDSEGKCPQSGVSLTVKAVVHHPMDWSPPRADNLLTSSSGDGNAIRKRNTDQTVIENSHESAKRLRYDSIDNVDSGVNLSHSISPSTSHNKRSLTETAKLDDDPLLIDFCVTTPVETKEVVTYQGGIELNLDHQTEHQEVKKSNIEVKELPALFGQASNVLEEQAKVVGYYDARESWD